MGLLCCHWGALPSQGARANDVVGGLLGTCRVSHRVGVAVHSDCTCCEWHINIGVSKGLPTTPGASWDPREQGLEEPHSQLTAGEPRLLALPLEVKEAHEDDGDKHGGDLRGAPTCDSEAKGLLQCSANPSERMLVPPPPQELVEQKVIIGEHKLPTY